MTAFFVASVEILNPEKFREYSKKAGETFVTYGGEVVMRGLKTGVLVGAVDHNAVGIIKFSNKDTLLTWYNSDEYQTLVPLREEACKMSIVTYDELP